MKIGNTKNEKDNTKTTDNSDKVGGAGDQANNGSKLGNVLKKSVEVSGPLKTMGGALHTGLNLPIGALESAV